MTLFAILTIRRFQQALREISESDLISENMSATDALRYR